MFEERILLPEAIKLTPDIQFGLYDVDLLLHAGLHAGKVSITNSKKTLNSLSDALHYDQPRCSAMRLSAIHDLILNGYTLRLFGAHQYSSRLAQLAEYIELIANRKVHINVYLTGPDVQGLAVHADPHDVLVYQLSGTKRWFVESEPSGGFHDFTIRPGQMLFMQQGVQHYAANDDHSHSLHVSISLHGELRKTSGPNTSQPKAEELVADIRQFLVETCRRRFGTNLSDNDYVYSVPRIVGKDLIFNSAQECNEASIRQAVDLLLEGRATAFYLRGVEYLFPELPPVVFPQGINLTLKVSLIGSEMTHDLISEPGQNGRRPYYPSSLKYRLTEPDVCLWVLNPHCVLKNSKNGYLNATASDIGISLPLELVDRLRSGPVQLGEELARKLVQHNVIVPAPHEQFQ